MPALANGDYQIKVTVGETVVIIDPSDEVLFKTVAAERFVITQGDKQVELTANPDLANDHSVVVNGDWGVRYLERGNTTLTAENYHNANGQLDGQIRFALTDHPGTSYLRLSRVVNEGGDPVSVNWFVKFNQHHFPPI